MTIILDPKGMIEHLIYIIPGQMAASVRGKMRRDVLDEISALQLTYNADAIPHSLARAAMGPLDLERTYDSLVSMGVIRKFVIAEPTVSGLPFTFRKPEDE